MSTTGSSSSGKDPGTTATTAPQQKKIPLPSDDDNDVKKKEQEQIIRMAYMDMITDAFADVLEDLRQKQESDDPIDVETLVDCLQNGLDVLLVSNNNNYRLSSFSETDFEFGGGDTTRSEDNNVGDDSNKSDDDEDDEDVKLTPHESRRRQLGYLLVDQL
jgi:hypothetical protein